MNTQSRKPCDAGPARIAALPSLPVFFNLTGRPALVIGGTAAAAWKAELLAAAGARVTVVADLSGEEMEMLAEAGTVRHVCRAWADGDLAGIAIAVADAADETEAARVRAAASRAGVPVNVIDRPSFCDFQFGSIVNRDPVVVAVSTDGAAPVLGQAIRRRIETLLPRRIGAWARAVKTLRGEVAARIPDAQARRAFWERFADLAFTREPGDKPEAEILDLAGDAALPAPSTGRVTLVGAGPGDAEYLTLKAVRALQAADVILFDDLVSDEVLELARREASRMMVGKRGGRDSCRQEEVNALMVRLGRQGKRVVRLKSGDPMIFGRAGEEIAELEAAGIPVDIVPGVTAAMAMAARLGISLTHRDHAQSVGFLTGHSRNGGLPDTLPLEDLVGSGRTAVVYMGGRTAGDMAARLIARGIDPATPVAAMRSISRPEEASWFGALADLGNIETDIPGDGPVLIAIGQVMAVATRRSLAAGIAA